MAVWDQPPLAHDLNTDLLPPTAGVISYMLLSVRIRTKPRLSLQLVLIPAMGTEVIRLRMDVPPMFQVASSRGGA